MNQNAATGNPMIPVHPQIQAQQQRSTGAQAPSAPNGQAPAQAQPAAIPDPTGDPNYWSNLLGYDEAEPQGQPTTPTPAQQAPVQGESQQPSQDGLTPEQKAVVAQTQLEQQAQPPQQPTQQPTQPSMEQAQQQAEQWLLQNDYALNEEQRRQLISEPDVAIPQLAARMHVKIMSQMGLYMNQAIQQFVPQLALQAMQKQMGAIRAEQTFFSSYPSLARPEFRPVVLQMLKYAKNLNPQATREKVMQEAAEMAAWKLKVPLQAAQQQQSAQQPQRGPVTPAQVQQQMPFIPAANGGAPAQVINQPTDNIFEQLAMDTSWP